MQQLISTILGGVSDAMMALDELGCIQFANPVALEFLGSDAVSVTGKTLNQICSVRRSADGNGVDVNSRFLDYAASLPAAQNFQIGLQNGENVNLELTVTRLETGSPLQYLLCFKRIESPSDGLGFSRQQPTTVLENRLQLERLVSDIAKGFVHSALHRLDREILTAIENLCRFMNLAIAAVFQFDNESGVLRNQLNWAVEGTIWNSAALENEQLLLDLQQLLRLNVRGRLEADLLTELQGIETVMRALQIKGLRFFTLQAKEGVFGLILFGEFSATETLDEHAQHTIETVAELIAHAEDRRRIHMELRKSESYLSLAQNVAEIGSWEYSPGRDITRSSRQLDKLFGVTVDSKPHSFRGWRKVIHEQDRNRVVHGIINALRDGIPYSTTYRIIRGDGDVRWHHIKARIVRDTFGENKLIAVNYDITDRKEYQDKLEASERRYRQLVEATPDAIVVHRANKILYANPASARMLCAESATALVGLPVMDFVHPDFRDFVQNRVQKIELEVESVPLAQQKLIRLDGKSIDVEIIGIPVNYDGEVAIQAIIRDITERNATQLKLRESEEKLRLMVEHANDAIFTLRPDFEISYISPAIHTQIGHEPEFFVGRPLQRWIHGEDVAKLEHALEALEAEPHKKVELEYRIRNVMREWCWHSTTLSVILGDDAAVQGFVGVAKDVTPRKEVEKALRDSEREMRAMFEQAHDAIVIFDEKRFRILDVNKRACQLYRYTREQLLQLSPRDLSVDADEFLEYLQQALQQNAILSSQTSHQRADGKRVLLELNSSVVNYKGAQAVLCSLHDITERVAAQEEIRKLSLVASKTSNGVVITDRDGYVEWINEGFTRISGYSLEDLSGRRIGDLKAGAATDPAVLAEIQQGIKNGQKIDAELLNYDNKGLTYWAQLQITPIVQSNKREVKNFVAVMTNITDLKHHEAELKAAKRELEASNQVLEIRVTERTKDLEMAMRKLSEALEKEKILHDLKSRFVSMVSHEFRTPLSSILSSTELLDRYINKLDEKGRKARFKQIYHSVARMTEILDQVVSLSQSEALTQSFEPSLISMPQFVRSTLQEFRNEFAPAQEIDLKIVQPDSPEKGLEHSRVDVKLLEPALMGVLKNAVQYSAAETNVQVGLYLNSDDVIVVVSDRGVGIPQDEVSLIFEPFHRAANVEIVPGTGLGLVFVKQCLERHGGDVAVESSLGKGTTVTMRLPRKLPQSSAEFVGGASNDPV